VVNGSLTETAAGDARTIRGGRRARSRNYELGRSLRKTKEMVRVMQAPNPSFLFSLKNKEKEFDRSHRMQRKEKKEFGDSPSRGRRTRACAEVLLRFSHLKKKSMEWMDACNLFWLRKERRDELASAFTRNRRLLAGRTRISAQLLLQL
jgi:hypothetical protein